MLTSASSTHLNRSFKQHYCTTPLSWRIYNHSVLSSQMPIASEIHTRIHAHYTLHTHVHTCTHSNLMVVAISFSKQNQQLSFHRSSGLRRILITHTHTESLSPTQGDTNSKILNRLWLFKYSNHIYNTIQYSLQRQNKHYHIKIQAPPTSSPAHMNTSSSAHTNTSSSAHTHNRFTHFLCVMTVKVKAKDIACKTKWKLWACRTNSTFILVKLNWATC